MARLRPIGHDDRLSIVDHLDELRTRLFVSLAAIAVAFAFCFWQNHALLHALNRALPHTSTVAGQQGLAAVPSQTSEPAVPPPTPAPPGESRPDRYYPLRLLAVIVVAALIGSILVLLLR